MLGARNRARMEEDPVGPRHRVAGGPVGYKHGMKGKGDGTADGAAQAVNKEQEPEWRVPERGEHIHFVHIPPRVGDEEKARLVLEEDRGKQELRVYPQPVHMLAQVRGGPEVVELNEYLEGKVGQRVHYPSVLRPEALPRRLQTRRLQAITGQAPVQETIMTVVQT